MDCPICRHREQQRRYVNGFPPLARKPRRSVPRDLPPTDELTLAYLAGLIDGEGYVGVKKNGGVEIVVGMTDESVIRWLCSLGGIYGLRRSTNPRWNDCHIWRISRRADVQAWLLALWPHLRVKRAAAERVLDRIEEGGHVAA